MHNLNLESSQWNCLCTTDFIVEKLKDVNVLFIPCANFFFIAPKKWLKIMKSDFKIIRIGIKVF